MDLKKISLSKVLKTTTLGLAFLLSPVIFNQAQAESGYQYGNTYSSAQKLSVRERLLKKFKKIKYKKNNQNKFYFRKNISTRKIKINQASKIIASIRPIRLSANKNNLAENNLNVFNLGFRMQGELGGFVPAADIEKISFEIQNNRGGLTDFRNLSLVIGGEEVDFNQNGFLTLQLRNLRLARGESKNLQIQLKVNDKNAVSQLGGSFRLKLKGITAVDEINFNPMRVEISGQTVSSNIVWNPTLTSNNNSGLGQATFSSQTIYGKALSAGEKTFVLSLRLNASYEDLLLKKLTVRNSFGSGADNLINRINLVDLGTGEILAQKRMIGGESIFTLRGNVSIPRNSFMKLGFQVIVKDSSSQNSGDNRLKLTVNDSDIEIYGYGSGREIPNSRKNITLDAQTFTLNQGGGITAGFASSQPDFISAGFKNDAVHFQLSNHSSQRASLGRISFQTILSGVQFTGGLSLDDAEIFEIYNGRRTNSSLFGLTSASGNILTFDANNEIYLEAGQTRNFALTLSMTNISSSSDYNDSINIQILGDNTQARGTLSQLRTAGNLFIWSDHSGRPHIPGKDDWFSGYLVDGIPTNNLRIKRD